MSKLKLKVFFCLSGGVDSSVTAALLKEQGYQVTGVYMKNWSKDLPGMPCPWKQDYQDAKRVAVQLGIPFKMYDFEKEYRQKVVEYMLAEYQAGRTPNPDIMCNQEIKFKLFFDTAIKDGADLVATGHYARVVNSYNSKSKEIQLLRAKDENKDQTYFLYRVSESALAKTLFPLGDYTKPEVRKLAKKFGLVTANKAESMGICFVGKVGIKDFLVHELGPQKKGDVVDEHSRTVGQHEGAIFYTIGQRHGLDVGGGLPYYVTGKDMKKNIVYVSTDLNDKSLWDSSVSVKDVHWISARPTNKNIEVRTRHRAKLVKGVLEFGEYSAKVEIQLKEDVRAITPGQSIVFYQGDVVLGGGIIY